MKRSKFQNKKLMSTFFILYDGKVVSLFSNCFVGYFFGGHDFFSRLRSIVFTDTEITDFIKERIIFLSFEKESLFVWNLLFNFRDVLCFLFLYCRIVLFFFFFRKIIFFFNGNSFKECCLENVEFVSFEVFFFFRFCFDGFLSLLFFWNKKEFFCLKKIKKRKKEKKKEKQQDKQKRTRSNRLFYKKTNKHFSFF